MLRPLSQSEILKKRRQAHHLKALLQSGQHGLTEAFIAAVDEALTDHELVKVKLRADTREDRLALSQSLCEKLEATLIQSVGHTLTLFRHSEKLEKKRERATKKD